MPTFAVSAARAAVAGVRERAAAAAAAVAARARRRRSCWEEEVVAAGEEEEEDQGKSFWLGAREATAALSLLPLPPMPKP